MSTEAPSSSLAQKRMSLQGKRVWVAGDRGMVGQALLRRLASEDCEVVVAPRSTVDLRRQVDVERWMADVRPALVFVAAAKVGGILANDTRPAEFLYDNLLIQANIVEAAYRTGVEKLMLLGSSCIYPKLAPQPMQESALLTGPLEPTNEWYAIAKIAGIKLGQAYRRQHGFNVVSVMPTNLYGPHDNFDLTSSHVLPALMRKIDEAHREAHSEVVLWGTGKPLREFMHVDDLASACAFLMERFDESEHINIGTGEEVEIRQLADMVAKVVGYRGAFTYDTSKPDGTPRKLMDSSRLHAMGWTSSYPLGEGLRATYDWYVSNVRSVRAT